MTDGARPPGSVRTSAMRRQLREIATERLGYKAAALFFALVLWLVVSTEEPAEQLVPVRLSLELDPAVELRGERPQLRALVAGRGRTLLALFDSPPVVRRGFGASVPDSVRIVIRPGDVELPPGVEATVRDIQPRSLLLRFRRVQLDVGEAGLPVIDSPALVAQPDALPADRTVATDSAGTPADTAGTPASRPARGPLLDEGAAGGSAPAPGAGAPPQGNDTAARGNSRNRGTARRILPPPRERAP